MLVASYTALRFRAPTSEEGNMCLEAFLLHARNLRECFRNDSHQPDDILLSDYVTRMPRIAMPYLRRNRRRLNRRLAHASYSRQRLTPRWDTKVILSEILAALKAFLIRLDKDSPKQVPWFEESMRLLTEDITVPPGDPSVEESLPPWHPMCETDWQPLI
jgi:hypothetical protein